MVPHASSPQTERLVYEWFHFTNKGKMELKHFSHLPEVTWPINCEPWFTLRSSWPPAQSPLRVRTHTHTPHTLYYHPLFSNWAFTYTKAWRIKSNCMDKSAHYTHIVLAFIIQRTHFLTCIFHYSLAPRLLPLTDTTQGRGASDTGSGNLSCDPELLTECLIFIAT